MYNSPKFIVVIGGSAGGLNALLEPVQHFNPENNIAYCVVLHLSGKGIGDFVVHRIKQVTSMECNLATDGERKHLLRKLEIDCVNKGYTQMPLTHVEKQKELETHINKLKEILNDLQHHDTAA